MPVGSRPMDYETVQVERRGGELRITLNRPETMNAWNEQFGLDLRQAVEAAAAADQALEWGLINRVAADDEFEAEVDALAQRLAAGPTRSYAGTKRQLNAWLYARFEQQLELEASIQHELAASEDFAEGVRGFVEKRPARF